jgi:ABC-type cobalamin/Fe3+-siderophores transport system ATPase subunit
MTSPYPRGSEWRKWDLHIHSPESFHWNGGKRFVDMNSDEVDLEINNILTEINSSDVAVFAIVDYWTIEGYIKINEYISKNNDSLVSDKKIIPGIEIRIEAPVDYRLNMQVLFSPDLTNQSLRDFRQELKILSTDRNISEEALIEFARTLSSDKADHHGHADYKENDNSALMLGSKTAVIKRESFEAAINSLPSREKCLIVMPWDTSDGLVDLDWSKHPDAANYFLQLPDVFESRKQEVKDIFNGIKTIQNEHFFDNFQISLGGKSKPVICGSDAHKISDYGNFPSDKNTWIKSDPTYEGLRQIKFEPKERVSIQKQSPESNYIKNCFELLRIKGNLIEGEELGYDEKVIPLNRDLVTLIGGRGTGKSILLDCLLKTLSPSRSEEDRLRELTPELFEVNLSVGQDQYQLFSIYDGERFDYLHVRQGDIKKKVQTPALLSNAIKNMLNIEEEEFSEMHDDKIFTSLSNFRRACEILEERDDNNYLVHDIEIIDNKIESNKNLISTLTTESNKKLVEEYRDINLKIENLNILIGKLVFIDEDSKDKIDLIHERLKEINSADAIEPKIRDIEISKFVADIKSNKEKLVTEVNLLNERRDQIKEKFSEQGVNQDISGLLEKVGHYQAQIQKLEELKMRVTKNNNEIVSQVNIISGVISERVSSLEDNVNEIEDRFAKLKTGKEGWSTDQIQLIEDLLHDVKISAEIAFNCNAFYEGLAEIMNGNKFKSTSTQTSYERIKELFKVESYQHLQELLSGELKLNLNEDEVVTIFELSRINDYVNSNAIDLLEYLTLSKYQKKYLSVNANVLYKDKPPEKLSVGQRGTFYLCMMLATDPFGSPFVFDQPEDDLDNEFIVEELVPIFRKIKKYRQVIIATHNANLVVNADAEQVIVASNNEELLSYESGALEHTKEEPNMGIRENVCRILEGGKDAFERRELKYGIK